MDALPLRIFNFAESPYQAQINQAYAGSLVLIVLILITSFSIRGQQGDLNALFGNRLPFLETGSSREGPPFQARREQRKKPWQ